MKQAAAIATEGVYWRGDLGSTPLLVASTDDFDPDGWNVRVQDDTGRMSDPDLRIATTGVVGGVEQHSLTWVFAVGRESDHFTLLLRDRQVDLAPLLDEDPAGG